MNPLSVSQPNDVRLLAASERDLLIISAVQVDGTWQVVSRYSDDTWRLSSATTNVVPSMLLLKFDQFPACFKDSMKAMAYRYLRRGCAGGKRPGARQMVKFLQTAGQFLKYLSRFGITEIAAVSSMTCANYVQDRKSYKKSDGGTLSTSTLDSLFRGVQQVFHLSQFTSDPMPAHPWPDDTVFELAGRTSGKRNRALRGGRTPLIPDDDFCRLFQAAWSVVEGANRVLDVRDKMEGVAASMKGAERLEIRAAKVKCLQGTGLGKGLMEFGNRLNDIRTSCYIVAASLSGCRNHELANIHANSCYRTLGADGEIYFWMKSKSEKTDEGHTQWMVPEAVATALKVMDRWALSHQRRLKEEIEHLRSQNPASPIIAEAQRHVGAIFLGKEPKKKNRVRTLSVLAWNTDLKEFAQRHGVKWNISSHQFRRKFANYAARSQFGDLRYLKQHFKHWSFDMTLGYAMNEHQELALYSEIYDELADIQEAVVAGWMDDGNPLAGGLGERVLSWRGSHEVTLFKDHKTMVRTLAQGFGNLRSNGHAWCTADQGIDCVGNGGLEKTRCTDCAHAVIGSTHSKFYLGLLAHLKTTLACEDIGESGLAYVRRSITRCENTLKRLGVEFAPSEEMV